MMSQAQPLALLWLSARLRHRVGAVKKEDCDLLVCLPSDVDCTMGAITRLAPVRLACCNFNELGLAAIPEFDCSHLAAHDYGHPMERVAVPRCCLTRR